MVRSPFGSRASFGFRVSDFDQNPRVNRHPHQRSPRLALPPEDAFSGGVKPSSG